MRFLVNHGITTALIIVVWAIFANNRTENFCIFAILSTLVLLYNKVMED